MSADAGERLLVEAVSRAVCAQWRVAYRGIEYPEDSIPRPHRPIDGVVATDQGSIVVEHTRHQSFPAELEKNRWFEPLLGWADAVRLDGDGHYYLEVRAEDLRGVRFDFAALEEWARTTAASFVPRPILTGDRHVAEPDPRVVGFLCRFRAAPSSEGTADGTVHVRSMIDFDQLAGDRIQEMSRTLGRKLHKLAAYRTHEGVRSLFILENRDLQLVNPDNVATAIRTVLAAQTELPVPDAIVVANVFRDSGGLTWVKDHDEWQPTDRYYVPFELPPAEPD